MKKMFILSTLCAVAACAVQASPFSAGFFAGAHMGGSQHRAKFSQVYNLGVGGTFRVNSRHSLSNFFGGLSLGYRHTLPKNFTVALLLQADFFDSSPLTINSGSNTAPVKNIYRRNYTIMPEMIFGYVWPALQKRWHTGIGFGVPYSSFSSETTNVVAITPTTMKTNRTQTGVSTSLHVDYAVTQDVSFNFAFGYEWYPKLNIVWGPEFTPGVNNTQYNSTLKLGGIKGHLGVSYRF